MGKYRFLIWKPAFFCKVKEIKHLSGGVVLYAAQTNEQIDAEIVKKGGFQTEIEWKVTDMSNILKIMIIGILIGGWSCSVYGQEVTRAQIKGLDEQVQEIKSDVIAIAAELNLLEEKLLYPSHTQISMFLSMNKGEKFRLDSVEILLDGAAVTHHLYTFKELEALKMGGVQRIYTGNIQTGEHSMQVSFSGLTKGGNAFERSESFKVKKDVGPNIVEITLDHQGITFKNR
ncbi:MAG: hypothetical protein QM483_10165 [Desulfuromusa sp.]